MKNKKSKLPVTTVTEVATAEVVPTIAKQLGRPSNPNSNRQKQMAEREAKRTAGLLKKGRPIVGTSKRQSVLAARATKIANGGTLQKGRPIVPTSKRQIGLAAKAAKETMVTSENAE